MALIDLALVQENVFYVDATTGPSNTDLVNAGVLSADTVVYHGDGDGDLTRVLGVNVLSGSYTVATGGRRPEHRCRAAGCAPGHRPHSDHRR
ncbi:hypothetical protein [Paracoccus sp. MC1862]|uniref:hypothetical protein n=1 Tax=Paracoccus sp. MC1862 TaxID=2760307 RepID=UPI0016040CD4|nr:hypothetical protein [Paracoccus sp. MC1862]MBB1496760.1 hypothetical protein [Paracoccus sp. MC1862]